MKHTYGLGFIAAFLLTLTSCTIGIIDSSSSGNSSSHGDLSSFPGDSSSPHPGSNEGTSSPTDAGDPYYKPDALKHHFVDLKLCSDTLILPSTGNQKILVIPVEFRDYPASSLDGGAEEAKERIRKTFFGTSEETGWESVSSYYEKSSYGKLHLSGTVTDWYDCGYTLEQADSLKQDGANDDATWYILRDAVNWYKRNHSDIKEYDQNNDGYIDAVWMVYSAPYDLGSYAYDIQWAYTFWDYEQSPNKNSPVANVYAWASYSFIEEGGYRYTADAHTFIHETGHVMGLDDYYTYDDGDWGPAGVLDMMDGNIGDHNAYSKMVLEWTLPYVAQNTGSITLRPFESSGDCLLIGNNWNGSAFDEYLVLEYYTPTGLNKQDAQYTYPSRPKMFTQSGVKVYHIDSRLGLISYTSRGWSFTKWTDTLTSTNNSYTSVIASNTASSSMANASYRLVHLLESSGQNSFYYGGEATNETLFQVGDSFGKTTFNSFKFNDSTKVPFTFEITDMNNEGVTISFTKK